MNQKQRHEALLEYAALLNKRHELDLMMDKIEAKLFESGNHRPAKRYYKQPHAGGRPVKNSHLVMKLLERGEPISIKKMVEAGAKRSSVYSYLAYQVNNKQVKRVGSGVYQKV